MSTNATQLSKFTRKVQNEIAALYLLKIRRDTGRTGGHQYLHERLEERWEMMHRFDNVQDENGFVPVWESGMDCDCVQYGGASMMKFGTYWDYEKHVEEVHKWAEGLVSVSIIPTWQDYNEAKDKSYSRDLIAEATENGHPHVVYLGGEA